MTTPAARSARQTVVESTPYFAPSFISDQPCLHKRAAAWTSSGARPFSVQLHSVSLEVSGDGQAVDAELLG